jgi:hypothetical protein
MKFEYYKKTNLVAINMYIWEDFSLIEILKVKLGL